MRFIQISKVLLLVLAVSFFIVGAQLNVASAGDSLDGKTFSVKINEHGKDGEATDDEIIFKDGTFFSADCEQYGFSAAPYEYRTKDGITLFITSSTSEKEGEIQWEGKVEGDEISGTMIWSKTGQDPIFYKYAGSLKK
ncbi:MAG: hypothetical protein DHS20C13_20720 [Thermodesulfobacteriota bacterium]|nr:MAG: hypothetical protein DHS20C13_20720 [Thermodesulfobacteriota bacterium]